MYSNISKRLKDVLDNFNVFWEEGILFLTILYIIIIRIIRIILNREKTINRKWEIKAKTRIYFSIFVLHHNGETLRQRLQR